MAVESRNRIPNPLEDVHPEHLSCWWWDSYNGRWEFLRYDTPGVLNNLKRWTHWAPYTEIPKP